MDYNIKGKEYIGIIKEGVDNGFEGRYLVYISELMASDETLKPIWAKNETIGSRFSRWLDLSTKRVLSSGTYQPLKAGMVVNVKFRSNSMESCYISNVVSYLPLVDKSNHRDSFYLLNKTTKGSWIYQDDSRRFTHIMHNDGTTNITLDDDGIVMQTGLPISGGVGGVTVSNAISIGKQGTKMEFGNSSIILDDSGILFKVGATVFAMTETGIKQITEGSVEIDAGNKLKLKGKDTKLMGATELQLYSNVLRMTGNLQTAVVGGVVNVSSSTLTQIQSTGQVNVEGTVKTKVTGPILELTSISNLYMDAPSAFIGSQNLVLSGSAMTISGSSIMMDGIVNHGMGSAAANAAGMSAMNIGLALSTDAANMALVTALGNNDVVSGIVNASIVSSMPGSAKAIGEILKPQIVPAKIGFSISEKVSYITASSASYDQVVEEQFKNLRETHELYR